MPCHGLVVRSTGRAWPEHDASQTEFRSQGMQLIVSISRQDEPGIRAGSLAEEGALSRLDLPRVLARQHWRRTGRIGWRRTSRTGSYM